MYIKSIKRLFRPSQYPLFRTVKLRYIFLHIFLIALLFSIPNSLHFLNVINLASELIDKNQDDIPEFQIKDNHLNISQPRDIRVNDYVIRFSTENSHPAENIIIFQKDGIQVDRFAFLSYQNLPMFHDKSSFIDFLKTYTSSRYFYFGLIISILLFIQFTTTVIKIILVSSAAHLLAILSKKKSRFMNWLKIITFIITLPSIILFPSLIVPSNKLILIIISWLLLIFLVSVTIKKLPTSNRLLKQ
ncbi:DUF1189 family protein [Macrococcus equi]|uniref:DUF1189 family protein n=1 Tax=Macrococcus equi TaxID=3395462 RepID=UPI0039BE8287